MTYEYDKRFTDIVHQVAVNQIYNALGWQEVSIIKEIRTWIDVNCGIDYLYKDISGIILTVQERFREQYSVNYDTFTLRYRRDFSTHEDRIKSEFYKIKADVFLYGVVNFTKSQIVEGQVDIDDIKFLKYILLNLRLFLGLQQAGFIQIGGSSNSYFDIKNKKLIGSIHDNKDFSSSFVAFNVPAYFELLDYLGINKNLAVPLHCGFCGNNF